MAWGKLKGVFGFGDDAYYDDEDFSEEEDFSDVEEVYPAERTVKNRKFANNVVSIHSVSSMKIVVYEPLEYEEASKMATDLKNRKTVIVNLHQLDKEVKSQIFYFITGAAFSLEGNFQKIANDIFIISPSNVEIEGVKNELKNKGIFIW